MSRDPGELVRPTDNAAMALAIAAVALDLAEGAGASVRRTAPLRRLLGVLQGNNEGGLRLSSASTKESAK